MEVAFTAMTKNTGISVKKIKPVADLVRGKNVEAALQALLMLLPIAMVGSISFWIIWQYRKQR